MINFKSTNILLTVEQVCDYSYFLLYTVVYINTMNDEFIGFVRKNILIINIISLAINHKVLPYNNKLLLTTSSNP